jgi:DNA (cytosine-5)-methyltransferase 1
MAAMLRELIKAGLIAPGDVDERSILDVDPFCLTGYTQCHFFAGIGVWSRALRRAGWGDERPIWTGSCPCQPFSSAGKGAGFDDKRHLWPPWFWLISQCKPEQVFGEQVDKKAGEAWLDLVSTDLENEGYAIGSTITAACGFGAPIQRKRIYWIADRTLGRSEIDRNIRNNRELADTSSANDRAPREQGRDGDASKCTSSIGSVASAENNGLQRPQNTTEQTGRHGSTLCGTTSIVGSTYSEISQGGVFTGERKIDEQQTVKRTGPVNGFWQDADWLGCRDGKLRPVEPGTFPLAHGVTHRMAKLHGIGNALNAEQAQAFIESYMEILV